MVWELVFMMLVLKLPILYLCAVVWWAIKAEPRPLEGAAVTARIQPEPGPERVGRRATRRRRPRLGPGPARRDVPRRRAALARSEARR